MSDVGVLDKVMAILQSYPDGVARLDPRAVAARLGMSAPTAYRLMKGMAEHGLLEQDAQGYRLGVTLLHLGSRVADGLEVRHVARPHLEWLRDRTQENAELHLRHGSSRVPVEVVPSRLNLRTMGQVGVPFPLHVGASAKVLLAWLEADEGEALARTSHAHQGEERREFDASRLSRDLARVRRQGWAFTDGEREVGVASVAAPVRDRFGSVVAAVVLAGPSSRLAKKPAFRQAVDLTTEAGARVSKGLGLVEETGTREGA
ncbi:MAG: IclR family transcriptional regulator [Nocardioidaceae bacterium]